jgi:hypothetical protein
MVTGAGSVVDSSQPARVGNLQPAILRLPFVERRAADAVLAADIRCLGASFLLPQDRNVLLFVEPLTLHRPPPLRWRTLPKSGGSSGAQVIRVEKHRCYYLAVLESFAT